MLPLKLTRIFLKQIVKRNKNFFPFYSLSYTSISTWKRKYLHKWTYFLFKYSTVFHSKQCNYRIYSASKPSSYFLKSIRYSRIFAMALLGILTSILGWVTSSNLDWTKISASIYKALENTFKLDYFLKSIFISST